MPSYTTGAFSIQDLIVQIEVKILWDGHNFTTGGICTLKWHILSNGCQHLTICDASLHSLIYVIRLILVIS